MTGSLDITQDAECWSFVLNRPAKMNALDADLIEALIAGVETAHASGARMITLSGAGRNFSAGFDFGEIETQSDGDLLLRFVRIETLLQLIASSPCLTVAFAQGRNFGAGVDLYAVCKHRFCTPDASFRMPGLKFGLVLGSRRFRDLEGQEKALEDPAKVTTYAPTSSTFPALSVPGLRPVSVKGIQAALRALGPSLDRARPALAEGQGCALTRTLVSERVVSTTEFPQWVWKQALRFEHTEWPGSAPEAVVRITAIERGVRPRRGASL